MPVVQCPSAQRLSAFLVGEVSDVDAREIAEHLETCAVCDQSATSLEKSPDRFLAQLLRPTGDASVLSDDEFRGAVAAIAQFGRDPASDEFLQNGQMKDRVIGQYQLLEKLGQGGMGAVYKALHTRLDKIVALKLLPPERMQDTAAIARFDREMKAVGRLDHKHIVRAMDAGEAGHMHYLVMEHVEGIDLSRLVRQHGRLPIAEACEIIRQAALGLEHAHANGMVHRDIKPSNLMLTSAAAPEVKILDMGLALLADFHASGQRDLTGSGQLMGTLDYMAPEQGGDSHDVDIRVDIYSLGATLYKLLVGEAIYQNPKYKTQLQKMMALAGTPAPAIQSRRGDVPDELAAVIHRMIDKDPSGRPQTPAEVAAALEPWASQANLALLLDGPSGDASASPERPSAGPVETRAVAATDSIATTQPLVRPGRSRPKLLAAALVGLLLIGITLAMLFAFRTRHGTITVEVDDKYRNDVTLNLKGEDQTLQVSDKSGWTINLREGNYQVDLGESKDQFSIDKGNIEVRRGEDIVVRITAKEKPEPDHGDPETGGPENVVESDVGQRAVEWIARHNTFGPDHDLVKDAAELIESNLVKGNGFSYRFGDGLMTDGRPAVLAVHGGSMFVHHPTGEQAESMGLVDSKTASIRSSSQQGRRAERPEFSLAAYHFDDEETLGTSGQLTGSLVFDRLRPADQPDEHYWVRVTFVMHRSVALYQGIAGDLAVERGNLQLKLDNPLPDGQGPTAMTVFIELGAFDGSEDDFDNFVALSDPVSTVLTIHPTKE